MKFDEWVHCLVENPVIPLNERVAAIPGSVLTPPVCDYGAAIIHLHIILKYEPVFCLVFFFLKKTAFKVHFLKYLDWIIEGETPKIIYKPDLHMGQLIQEYIYTVLTYPLVLICNNMQLQTFINVVFSEGFHKFWKKHTDLF